MPITTNANTLLVNLSARFTKFQSTPALKTAFTRIAIAVEAQTKLNIRRLGMIDEGHLINSIRHEFFMTDTTFGVNIGSYGIVYARIHELGGPFTDRMRRAMFASLKRRGKLNKNYKPKGVVRNGFIVARPYLRPALVSKQAYILDQLSQAMGLGK